MLKRIITSLFCLFLIFVSIPFLGNTQFSFFSVFADSNLPTGYEPATTDSDLIQSFSDYVKSRNANFTGSLPDATDLYILNKMRKGSDELNSNLDTIKQNLAKKSDTGGKIIWYLDSTVTDFYNDLFDFLLRDLDLEVGDTADKTLYSGEYFVDDNGQSSLVFVTSSTSGTSFPKEISESTVIAHGSQFTNKGGSDARTYLLAHGGQNAYVSNYVTSVYNGNSYTLGIGSQNYFSYRNFYLTQTNSAQQLWCSYDSSSEQYINGFSYPCVWKTASNNYHLGMYRVNTDGSYNGGCFIRAFTDGTANNATITFVTIDNKTINNNRYEGDTFITNEGDVITEVTPGGKDPGWDVSGGQGSSGDTIINFPDFQLPDLNIDWSIQGLGNKFPFSIPFDIASLVSVLNAEPEAPRFEGTVNFGFTTWDYDINLEQFDSVAHACRIAELLLLVFGLILITRSIIKG